MYSATYTLKLYEDDPWPNADDLCYDEDIDLDDRFNGFGTTHRVLFTDGTNCTSEKELDFYLFLKEN